MSIAFVANLQASKHVKPCNRTFDWPTRFAKPAAMGRAPIFASTGVMPARSQALPMWLGTVAPVTLNDLRFVQRATPLASNVRNGLVATRKLH
jgi:hypothetical protein